MSDKSHTTSGTAKPAIASKSKSRSIDSNMLRTSSTRSGVVDSSGIGSFLGKAFGGSASLVDVRVVRLTDDEPLSPRTYCCVAELDFSAAARRTPLQGDDGKRDSIAEVKNLLGLRPRHVESTPPVFEATMNRRPALVHLKTHGRRVPDCVLRQKARHCIDITAVRSVHSAARKLNQIGGRGLLSPNAPVPRQAVRRQHGPRRSPLHQGSPARSCRPPIRRCTSPWL